MLLSRLPEGRGLVHTVPIICLHRYKIRVTKVGIYMYGKRLSYQSSNLVIVLRGPNTSPIIGCVRVVRPIIRSFRDCKVSHAIRSYGHASSLFPRGVILRGRTTIKRGYRVSMSSSGVMYP